MADLEDSELNAEELLIQRHRKERKDLQCRQKENLILNGCIAV